MKLNLKITSKLVVLVAVTMIGLCVAGGLAAYMVKSQMLAERTGQLKSMAEVGRNVALALQKQVEAGQLTKEAAVAEFVRRLEPMTYDNGTGYLFVYNMDGTVVYLPGFKAGTNRLEVLVNGLPVTRMLRDTVVKDGEGTVQYDFIKPGQQVPLPKMSYVMGIPAWNMFIGVGAYLDDLDLKLRPLIAAIGLAMLAIAGIAGAIAWLIGRSITRPLGALGARMKSLADGALDDDIPGVGRGDEVGAMAQTVQVFKDNAVRIRGLEQQEAEVQARAAAERRATMERFADDFERSVNGIVRSVSTAATGMQASAQSMTATASDASSRASTVGAASAKSSDNVSTVAAAAEELSASVNEVLAAGLAVERNREQGGRRRRAHQRDGSAIVERRREDRRGRAADP